MNKRIGRLLAVMVSLMLLVGCAVTPPTEEPSVSPTDTSAIAPSMDGAYVNCHLHLLGDRFTTDTGALLEENAATTLKDQNGNEVTVTLMRKIPDTMSAELSFDKPLWQNGEAVTTLTLSREETVILTDEDGALEYRFSLSTEYSKARWSLNGLTGTDIFVTAYHGGGVMLWLDTAGFGEDVPLAYRMTVNGDVGRVITGSYTIEGDTLTLTEDSRLARLVFRKKGQAWRFDESASAYHTLAWTPHFADGTVLAFGHAYEIEQGELYTYRVKDGDGNMLLVEEQVKRFIHIEPMSPTRLCVISSYPNTETQYRYIDAVTGECSVTYYNIVASNANEIVYLKDGRLVIEDPLVPDSAQTPDYGRVVAKSLSFAMLTDKELTVRYIDADGNTRIGAWDRQSGEELTRPLLIVDAGRPVHYGDSPVEQTLSASGDRFVPRPYTDSELYHPGEPSLYYSGVRCAAIRIDGVYRDLSDVMKDGTLTVEAFAALLEEDVQSGIATKTVDGTTVIRYGNDALHAVVLEPRADETAVYVGDVNTTLAYIRNRYEN